METAAVKARYAWLLRSPHSLGKLIEWKLSIVIAVSTLGIHEQTPHSLGKLIEWKLAIIL